MELKAAVKKSGVALAAAAAASTGALAADMEPQAPIPARPPMPPAATWDGIYVGGSLGASWLRSGQDDSGAVGSIVSFLYASQSVTGSGATTGSAMGLLGGLQLGANLQQGNFVMGLEGNFSWLSSSKASTSGSFQRTYNIFGSSYTYGGRTTRTSKLDELGTFQARFGIDLNGTMPYLTLGLAMGHITNTWSVSGFAPAAPDFAEAATSSSTSWVPGVVIGGGIEHRLDAHWSVRGEATWVGFQDKLVPVTGLPTVPAPGTFSTSGGNTRFSDDIVIARLGLNYRF